MFLARRFLRLTQPAVQTRLNTRLCSNETSTANETVEDAASAPVDPLKDRSRIVPVETSIRYLKSDAYKQTYGDNSVWILYKRNHKGQFPPMRTRKKCIRKHQISTGNPCPICRDEYLVVDYRNVDLLKQFISEHTGQILSYTKTGVCQRKHQALMVAIEKAWDHGYITFDVPFREYDYSQYNKDP